MTKFYCEAISQYLNKLTNANWSEKDRIEYNESVSVILETVKLYLSGKHSDAYGCFSKYLDEIDFTKQTTTSINKGKYFYRARCFDHNINISKKDLYHIPFNKIELVNNQRFSSCGLPCIYLGASIYTCWEEMDRPDFERMMVSAFKLKQNLNGLTCKVPCLSYPKIL